MTMKVLLAGLSWMKIDGEINTYEFYIPENLIERN